MDNMDSNNTRIVTVTVVGRKVVRERDGLVIRYATREDFRRERMRKLAGETGYCIEVPAELG